MGAAYRHDYLTAHEYFVGALENPPAAKLASPLTVVVASDDPATAEYAQRHVDWQIFAERVELHELAGGGHYFLRTRPNEAVQPVLRAAASLSSATEPTERGDRDVVPGATT
jgi:surfactin synthase thioesterase subunit